MGAWAGNIGVGDGGSGGAAAPPPELRQIDSFWTQEVIFGHSWHAQKLQNCPKVPELLKNFRAAKLQPSQFEALCYAYGLIGRLISCIEASMINGEQ